MKPLFKGRPSRVVVAALAALALSTSSGGALALASGSVVFDPTNWAENLRSATMSVKQYAQDVVRTKHMYDQLVHIAKNREKLLASVLFEGMTQQQKEAAADSIQFYDAVMKLESDLDSLQKRYDVKVNGALNAKLTVAEFMKLQKAEAQRGVKASQQSIDQDLKTLRRVQDTYTSVQKWQMQADSNIGHQQSLQLLNTQMNALVGQNAEVITALTKANMERTLDGVNDREKRAAGEAAVDGATARSRLHLQEVLKGYGDEAKGGKNPDLFK